MEMEINNETSTQMMFSDEEVKDMNGFQNTDKDYVEVTCGCTSRRYGDAVGTLRVYLDGNLEINCDCIPGCEEDKLSPSGFERHSAKETKKWKKNIWVIINGQKVPLSKTTLLKYYDQALKGNTNRSQSARVGHQDEFVRCTLCGKQRRFRLRNKDECRAYHDAVRTVDWTCSDTPNVRVKCADEEERASRRIYRGCSRSQTCSGCTSCVCFGCEICRFSDCSCQTCVDFTKNVKN